MTWLADTVHNRGMFASAPPRQLPRIPRTVWALGLVSLFMDVSSEIIHALLPLFLTTTLGVSVALVGLIDGVAESTASIVKVYSGYLSDRIGRRKPLILLGYGLGALSKLLFPIASGAVLVFGARFVDRVGKGLRGAPRDALVADVTPAAIRGRAYGVRQALDTTGAFLGPLLAVGLMVLFANDIRMVFWFAAIPAGLSVLCVILGVEDRTSAAPVATARTPVHFRDVARLGNAFWGVVTIGVVFALARFSEAFLILKASAAGLPLALAPLVLVVMNVVYALGAYPAGALSDALRADSLMLWGLTALIAADLSLAFAPGVAGAFLGIALWGVHMALTQGLLAKLVAESAPEHLRGSAFGLFNLATGLAMLLASVIAGLAWDRMSPAATFVCGAGFAGIACVLLLAGRRRSGRHGGGADCPPARERLSSRGAWDGHGTRDEVVRHTSTPRVAGGKCDVISDRQSHWDEVYGTRAPTELSWYQARPDKSLELFRATGVAPDEPVIDIGCGASRLVDELLDLGYEDLTLLDVSADVLAMLRERLGPRGARVKLVEQDVTTFVPSRPFALWHDRAVFHFLVDAGDRRAYVSALRRGVRAGGHAVIATFGPDGPERCSGLPTVRYDAETLAAELGPDFTLVESSLETHATPAGRNQQFLYCRFRRGG